MKNNILIVIDMQNDFIDGSLGSNEATEIISNASSFISNFNGEILFTMDTHDENYLNTNEGKHLPILHCIKDSLGHKLHKEIEKFIKDDTKIFEKNQFASLELLEYIKNKDITNLNIYLLGLCTDICVISNAILLKSFFPEVNIYVVKNACAGSSLKKHEAAIDVMQACHIDII